MLIGTNISSVASVADFIATIFWNGKSDGFYFQIFTEYYFILRSYDSIFDFLTPTFS